MPKGSSSKSTKSKNSSKNSPDSPPSYDSPSNMPPSSSSQPSSSSSTGQSNGSLDDVLGNDDDLLQDTTDKKGVSGFISKIFRMVSDPATEDIVSWNEKGDGFIVKNEFAFASQIMRTYFRHQNFSSFVRQLNFYGFHKRSSASSLTSFFHPYFKKGRQDLLPNIQRKSPEGKDANLKETVTALQSEVAELRQQNEDLFKIQQRILYIFSRYMRVHQNGITAGAHNAITAAPNANGTNNNNANNANTSGSANNTYVPSLPSPDVQHHKRARGSTNVAGSNDMKRRVMMLEAGKGDDYEDHTVEHDLHNDVYNVGHHPSLAAPGNLAPSSSSATSLPDSPDSASSSHIVDLNTDHASHHPHASHHNLHHHHTHTNSNTTHTHPHKPYGNHSLSNLDWNTDSNTFFHDLLGKLPANAANYLNSAPMNMQMPRANSVTFPRNSANSNNQLLSITDGHNSDNFNTRRNGSVVSTSNAANNASARLMDLAPHLASNPRQLLELLDRMGGPNAVAAAAAAAASISQESNTAGNTSRFPTSAPDRQPQTIRGVFEDMNASSSSSTSYVSSDNSYRKRKAAEPSIVVAEVEEEPIVQTTSRKVASISNPSISNTSSTISIREATPNNSNEIWGGSLSPLPISLPASPVPLSPAPSSFVDNDPTVVNASPPNIPRPANNNPPSSSYSNILPPPPSNVTANTSSSMMDSHAHTNNTFYNAAPLPMQPYSPILPFNSSSSHSAYDPLTPSSVAPTSPSPFQ